MIKRIKDKIGEINKYLNELDEIKPSTLEDYKNSIKDKAACERYFEKIIESVFDISFLIIKYKKLKMPDDDKQLFEILFENKIISEKVCKKMKSAKGMRNLLNHQYGNVDDEIVFESITSEINTDVEMFVNEITLHLKLK